MRALRKEKFRNCLLSSFTRQQELTSRPISTDKYPFQSDGSKKSRKTDFGILRNLRKRKHCKLCPKHHPPRMKEQPSQHPSSVVGD
ncbi:uncharacterized protein BDZ99DRAFT_421447, partial [Mytilinidion resinicola]